LSHSVYSRTAFSSSLSSLQTHIRGSKNDGEEQGDFGRPNAADPQPSIVEVIQRLFDESTFVSNGKLLGLKCLVVIMSSVFRLFSVTMTAMLYLSHSLPISCNNTE
jgi:hypothetical protein